MQKKLLIPYGARLEVEKGKDVHGTYISIKHKGSNLHIANVIFQLDDTEVTWASLLAAAPELLEKLSLARDGLSPAQRKTPDGVSIDELLSRFGY